MRTSSPINARRSVSSATRSASAPRSSSRTAAQMTPTSASTARETAAGAAAPASSPTRAASGVSTPPGSRRRRSVSSAIARSTASHTRGPSRVSSVARMAGASSSGACSSNARSHPLARSSDRGSNASIGASATGRARRRRGGMGGIGRLLSRAPVDSTRLHRNMLEIRSAPESVPPSDVMPRSLISITEALQRVLDATSRWTPSQVDLDDALGRVLAQDADRGRRRAPVPVLGDGRLRRDRRRRRADPAHRRRVARRHPLGPRTHRGRGDPHLHRRGHPARGHGRDPPGERASSTATDAIHTNAAAAPGEHIRGAGEDMRAQTVVLSAGTPWGRSRSARRPPPGWARSSPPGGRGSRCCAPETSSGHPASRLPRRDPQLQRPHAHRPGASGPARSPPRRAGFPMTATPPRRGSATAWRSPTS